MSLSTVKLALKGVSPYSQSRYHATPKLEGETAEAYDRRTWINHAHINRNGEIYIPAHAFHQTLIAAARYSKKQIPGQGKATWTAKFTSGILMMDGDLKLDQTKGDIDFVDIYANSDGKRGSGKRVMRRYPILHEWKATTEIGILDPIVTEDVFREIVGLAGLFIGLGRFRPENGGTNGRFKIFECAWQDNRVLENVLS